MAQVGFPVEEFRRRTARAQQLMAEADIAALLLTTDADLRYFTGFLTRFWESPTRPWFLVLSASRDPIAVIPTIGAALMQTTWIEDIRTWRAPDAEDDGVSLLAETLCEVAPGGTRIGLPSGQGTYLRMPLDDWARMQRMLADRVICSDIKIIERLRVVKSPLEIEKVKESCAVANAAFDQVPTFASAGKSLQSVFRHFQMSCLENGADWVPYVAGGAGQGGYTDVISPATPRPLTRGDVLMLDTGLVRDGYFCDFDRNFSVGPPNGQVASAHARLIEATRKAFDLARPGATAQDLFRVMDEVVTGGAGGSDAGRLGHGVGMQLTEPPSLTAEDTTQLMPGMVLTLEPGIGLGDGRIMVHEENIVVTEEGAAWLSAPQDTEIRVVDG